MELNNQIEVTKLCLNWYSWSSMVSPEDIQTKIAKTSTQAYSVLKKWAMFQVEFLDFALKRNSQ